MNPVSRYHALVVALLLAIAALLGLVAVKHTVTLGASAQKTSTAQLAARSHQLDKVEAALKRALNSKPPKLPKLPAASSPPAPTQRVIYHRPPPIVVIKHNPSHGDDGSSEGQDD